jgi:hypothetical protein
LDGWPGSTPGESVCRPKRMRAAVGDSNATAALTLVSPQFKVDGTRNRARFFLHHHSNMATLFHSLVAAKVVLNEPVMVTHFVSPLRLTCGGSKGSPMMKRPWVAVAAPPRSRRPIQSPRKSSRTRVHHVLGLWVLRVEIGVDGAPCYRGFLPMSLLARTLFHFIYK